MDEDQYEALLELSKRTPFSLGYLRDCMVSMLGVPEPVAVLQTLAGEATRGSVSLAELCQGYSVAFNFDKLDGAWREHERLIFEDRQQRRWFVQRALRVAGIRVSYREFLAWLEQRDSVQYPWELVENMERPGVVSRRWEAYQNAWQTRLQMPKPLGVKLLNRGQHGTPNT